jgi:hypothetical protein
MGLLDRLLGRSGSPQPGSAENEPKAKESTDEQALQRYRYLLRTAPPEAIEQAHTEAFAQLTPEQRAQVLKELSQQVPPSERSAVPAQPDPQSLARLATRAELRQPGILERTLGPRGMGGGMGMGGMGFGGMLAGSLLGSIAGTVIGSAIAHQFLGGFSGSPESFHHDMDAAHAQADTDSSQADSTDSDDSTDNSSGDDSGSDDYGSDDFGGGDFGGGDLGDA